MSENFSPDKKILKILKIIRFLFFLIKTIKFQKKKIKNYSKMIFFKQNTK